MIVATGHGVKKEKDELTWKYDWSEKEIYRLMISTAGDSAGNFALYSGYIFLPKEKKWKLIGTCKINGHWNTLKQLVLFRSPHDQKTSNGKCIGSMGPKNQWFVEESFSNKFTNTSRKSLFTY